MSNSDSLGAYPRKKPGRKPRPHEFVNGLEMKWCGRCSSLKALESFRVQAQRWDLRSSSCLECESRSGREWRSTLRARGHIARNNLAPGQRYARVLNRPDGSRFKVRLYQIWDSMKKRCFYPKQNRYERYGGRGITVCTEWMSYDAFRAWAVSHGYAKALTLDRIDVDGDYEPGNCRWIPVSQQQENTVRAHRLTLNGVTRTLPHWARLLGVTSTLLRSRRMNGWTDEQILKTPHGAPRINYTPKPRGRKPKSAVLQGFSHEDRSNG